MLVMKWIMEKIQKLNNHKCKLNNGWIMHSSKDAIIAANANTVIINNHEILIRRNENTTVYNRSSYPFDISRRQSPPHKKKVYP